MSRYILFIITGIMAFCCISIRSGAAPRILHSNAPGNKALWLILKKEAKGKYLLQLNREGVKEPESFKLTADTSGTANAALKFAPGEETRATAALKDVEDVITHTTANDADAAGDASGDINSFVNDVLKKDGSEGVMILPAAAPLANEEPAKTGGGWLLLISGLLAGAAGGVVVMRAMKSSVQKDVQEPEQEEVKPGVPATPEDAIAAAALTAQKLKKVQKDLRETKAILAQMTKQAETERTKAEAHDEDYKALEARLKTGDAALTNMQVRLADTQKELLALRERTGQQDTYFKAAASQIVRPFTDYVSGSRINPADKGSQAIVAEQVLMMGLHYCSLVRYGAGIWDEHDIYNVQRIGGLGAGQKAAIPQVIPVDAKSGAPRLVLSVAALLRDAGAIGAGMDVSIRGYRFGQ